MLGYFLAVLCFAFAYEVVAEPSCGRNICMSLTKCKPFLDFLHGSAKPLAPTVVEFLRSQQCGFENSFPKVCCFTVPEKVRASDNTRMGPVPVIKKRKKMIKGPNKLFVNLSAMDDANAEKKVDELSDLDVIKAMLMFYGDVNGFDLFRRKRGSLGNNYVEIR